MAEVIGFLREEATFGEKETLRLLRQNLPKEFTVYVETPIYKSREIRYPDFIILTNYGVIILEVKDWIMIERADPSGCTVRTRGNEVRHEKNPVNTAREMAISLSRQLQERMQQPNPGETIPWGFAAVLINLPPSVISQVRMPWGEQFILGRADLSNPNILLDRLRNLFPVYRLENLTRFELDNIRAVIYPVVEIQQPDKPVFVLDEQQEKIVAEPIRQEPRESDKVFHEIESKKSQEQLFTSIQVEPAFNEALPPEGEKLSQNTSIRLVRGFSGSGKTLVLIQRAKFLAAEYPDWKIGILTFNHLLKEQLESALKDSRIQCRTFHNLCMKLASISEVNDNSFNHWLEVTGQKDPILNQLGRELVYDEINWIRDIGLPELGKYISMERKRAGQIRRLSPVDRTSIYRLLKSYRQYLHDHRICDWAEVPLLALDAIKKNDYCKELYDAILIDEAQDWAPAWFQVINQIIKPETGVIFLADDPSQSIYRRFSWREKGISVVGRTRWLKIPYRNTFEIYRSAYSMIAENEEIQRSLAEEGERVVPELSSQTMRHGPRPLIKRCKNDYDEMIFIRGTVDSLRQMGIPEKQIAVLVRYKRDEHPVKKVLHGTDVLVNPIHSFKGLEMEAIIIPHLHETFRDFEQETSELRLMYMAMSRARSHLVMTYVGRLPQAYDPLRTQNLADFIS